MNSKNLQSVGVFGQMQIGSPLHFFKNWLNSEFQFLWEHVKVNHGQTLNFDQELKI